MRSWENNDISTADTPWSHVWPSDSHGRWNIHTIHHTKVLHFRKNRFIINWIKENMKLTIIFKYTMFYQININQVFRLWFSLPSFYRFEGFLSAENSTMVFIFWSFTYGLVFWVAHVLGASLLVCSWNWKSSSEALLVRIYSSEMKRKLAFFLWEKYRTLPFF